MHLDVLLTASLSGCFLSASQSVSKKKDQTKEVCLADVNQTPDAIQCIHDPEMRKQVEEILKQGSASAMSIF